MDYFATKSNIVLREFFINKKAACILFNPDITDADALRNILFAATEAQGKNINYDSVTKNILYIAELDYEENEENDVNELLSGDCILFLDKEPGHLKINVKKWDKRSVSEPPTETVTRGPREGFIEDIKTNLSLIERRLKTPALAIEKYQIGRCSSTTVGLLYISTIVDPDLVERVRRKLLNVDIDALTDSHYLEPLLEDSPNSIFHQTGVTEKPDIVSARLLEGRLAIVVDGSPMVLTIPHLMIEDYQSSEDYYQRNSFASFVRILRFFASIMAIILPGLFVAIQVYHYEVIPFRFLITLMNAIKGIPLPPLAEIFFVLFLFEIIRESSVRMPRAVGMAMSIVGALVLGDTAVKAGIIGSPSIMVIALSSLAMYTVPNMISTNTLLRAVFLVVGGLMGIMGLMISFVFLIHYLCSLDSYGSPFLAPFAPIIPGDLKDGLLKKPLTGMEKRPLSIGNINPKREKKSRLQGESK